VSDATVDLGGLSLLDGGHLLLKLALAARPVGAVLEVRGGAPGVEVDLRGWCRARGHLFAAREGRLEVTVGAAAAGRWAGAEQAGVAGEVSPVASPRWGLAARGAQVEAGVKALDYPLNEARRLWADEVPRLYAQAAAAQWDPETAVDWRAPLTHSEVVEDAVVQVMTYLVENETAALQVPARFVAQVHPHFREVLQLLAIQLADEARHLAVFTRRATLRRSVLGLSTAGGQASLATLYEAPDFEVASFLLSVLGEGTFVSLLGFIALHAPDQITHQVTRLAQKDEARHVAYGLAHLKFQLAQEPALRSRLALAVERRHQALRHTAGLNEEVFDALVLMAAGGVTPEAVRRGHDAVLALEREMDEGRRSRLVQLGFQPGEAAALSSLHTRNFM
jgi:hypothetical protein